jgi:hypothetical protein
MSKTNQAYSIHIIEELDINSEDMNGSAMEVTVASFKLFSCEQ